MKNQTQHAQNKMATMSVHKLLISMAVPIILSMLVQALYNIVDSIFVGKLSEDALNAVSLALPMQNLMLSVALGTSIGVNALLSKSLGAGRPDDANKAATNGIFLSFLSYLAFVVIGLLFSRTYFTAQTDIASIIQYGDDYLFIISVFSFGIFFSIMLERILQATGKTIFTMTTQLTGALINIILDPIFIFGLFGFPRLEVKGAALATVIGQISSAGLNYFFNIHYNKEISLRMKGFRPSMPIIRRIYSVGIPSAVMSSIGSVMVWGMNQILLAFTPTATAVFGVYFKLQSFVFMPVFGLNNGMVPIVAYNYGAQKPDRILKTVKLSLIYASGITIAGFLAFQKFPALLLSLFEAQDATGQLIIIGVPALRTISISFIVAGFCIVSSSVFQALGEGVLSLIMSIIRQLLVLLPVAWVLSKIYGFTVAWWAFPIAEVFSFAVAIIFLRRLYKQKIAPMYVVNEVCQQ